MTEDEQAFLDSVNNTHPDDMDMKRARDIVESVPGCATAIDVIAKRMKKATVQLNRITDRLKFSRRIKAFIEHGIFVNIRFADAYPRDVLTDVVQDKLNKYALGVCQCSIDEIDYDAELKL